MDKEDIHDPIVRGTCLEVCLVTTKIFLATSHLPIDIGNIHCLCNKLNIDKEDIHDPIVRGTCLEVFSVTTKIFLATCQFILVTYRALL